MGLVYHNGRFIPEEQIQKSIESERVLSLLRSFLDPKEPGLARILLNTFRSQGNAITYKELREAILAGDISPEWLEDWMQDYSRLVQKYLLPMWESAILAAAREKERAYPHLVFDPMSEGVRAWTATHAAEFITNVTTTQIEGIRAVVHRAAALGDMSAADLARAIRPMIGLTAPHSMANMKYYETLLSNGISEQRARDLAMRDAARRHRKRAYDIARTELCTAYNTGAFEGTKQAQAAGLLGETIKEWSTADDERVCKICGAMDGKQVAMDEDFGAARGNWSTRLHPPAHPGCRCGVKYIEVRPPQKSTAQNIKIEISNQKYSIL